MARLRALVPAGNAVAGVDLGERKQALVVTDHDGRVLARRSPQVSVHELGAVLDWAAERARVAGFAGLTVACEPTGSRWMVVQDLCAQRGLPLVCIQPLVTHVAREQQDLTGDKTDARVVGEETGDLSSQANALNGLGELLLATEQPNVARVRHAAALNLAVQAGEKHQQARAHAGLAGACQTCGDLAAARRHYQHALTLYTDLGAPEADLIRSRLTDADNAAPGRPGTGPPAAPAISAPPGAKTWNRHRPSTRT